MQAADEALRRTDEQKAKEGRGGFQGNPNSLANLKKGKSKPVLQDDLGETDLQAMDALWMQTGKAKTRRQAAWAPLYKKNLAEFRREMGRIGGREPGGDGSSGESGAASPTVVIPKWDGNGSCPTCTRGSDPIGADAGMDRVSELLGAEFAELEGRRL